MAKPARICDDMVMESKASLCGTAFARPVLVAAVLLFACAAARAAPPPTTLDLEVTGSAAHAPDAMTATFEATTTDADPARAQASLNAMMAKALAAARRTQDVTATTGTYSVAQTIDSPTGGKQTLWRARQRLDLRLAAGPESARAKAFLAMIGDLQNDGVLLQDLSGALSPDAAQKTEGAAIANAVHLMRGRATALADALGDTVGRVRHVSLDSASPVRPMFRVMAARAAPPPVAAPGDVSEQVTLRATVELTPAPPAPKSP